MDFFLLHLMKEVPLSFANIAQKILLMFLANQVRVIIITFDRYFSPSIKDNEHNLRGMTKEQQYRISGGDQVRRTDFSTELKNINFKQ